MNCFAVIGCGYGDEGKGLVTNHLVQNRPSALVVRHNGGAQSGHTVDTESGRFVFHELSSGSLAGADTFWADSFYPDLYKLSEEAENFRAFSGFVPKIFADARAFITIVDDIFLNMAVETVRGDSRHGSCGMGIYEADCRTKAGYGLTIGEISEMSTAALTKKLENIRASYVPLRIAELGLTGTVPDEYASLLTSREVLENYARQIMENLAYIQVVHDVASVFDRYDTVVFESGQGLLLDADCEKSLPHVTASKTGVFHPARILSEYGKKLDAVYYVTRSYVTKHGAGLLPCECGPERIGKLLSDRTNVTNPWQGSLRYAEHESTVSFADRVRGDLAQASPALKAFLVVTHLNETEGAFILRNGDMPWELLAKDTALASVFDEIYLSDSPFGISAAVSTKKP